jgi:hypothetical protein
MPDLSKVITAASNINLETGQTQIQSLLEPLKEAMPKVFDKLSQGATSQTTLDSTEQKIYDRIMDCATYVRQTAQKNEQVFQGKKQALLTALNEAQIQFLQKQAADKKAKDAAANQDPSSGGAKVVMDDDEAADVDPEFAQNMQVIADYLRMHHPKDKIPLDQLAKLPLNDKVKNFFKDYKGPGSAQINEAGKLEFDLPAEDLIRLMKEMDVKSIGKLTFRNEKDAKRVMDYCLENGIRVKEVALDDKVAEYFQKKVNTSTRTSERENWEKKAKDLNSTIQFYNKLATPQSSLKLSENGYDKGKFLDSVIATHGKDSKEAQYIEKLYQASPEIRKELDGQQFAQKKHFEQRMADLDQSADITQYPAAKAFHNKFGEFVNNDLGTWLSKDNPSPADNKAFRDSFEAVDATYENAKKELDKQIKISLKKDMPPISIDIHRPITPEHFNAWKNENPEVQKFKELRKFFKQDEAKQTKDALQKILLGPKQPSAPSGQDAAADALDSNAADASDHSPAGSPAPSRRGSQSQVGQAAAPAAAPAPQEPSQAAAPGPAANQAPAGAAKPVPVNPAAVPGGKASDAAPPPAPATPQTQSTAGATSTTARVPKDFQNAAAQNTAATTPAPTTEEKKEPGNTGPSTR